MPRRRNENGLKRQQRLESEQRREAPGGYVEPDDRQREEAPPAPIPPGVTQAFENLAPPAVAPRKDE